MYLDIILVDNPIIPYFVNATPEHTPGLSGPGDVLEGDLLPRAQMVSIVLMTAALGLDSNQVSGSEQFMSRHSYQTRYYDQKHTDSFEEPQSYAEDISCTFLIPTAYNLSRKLAELSLVTISM